jgi:hypothetical protein
MPTASAVGAAEKAPHETLCVIVNIALQQEHPHVPSTPKTAEEESPVESEGKEGDQAAEEACG